MKKIEEVEEEIRFQERQYDNHYKIYKNSEWELEKRAHAEICGRHAARRDALLWVIGK